MLLRSITKHVKDQNWFAVFLDFFIVVAGILIAFQITNWNEARAERALEAEYTERLHKEVMDLEAVRKILVAERIQAAMELRNATIKLLDLDSANLTPAECLWLVDNPGTSNPTDDLPLIIELLSSGRFSIFSNQDIEKALGDYLVARSRARDSRLGVVDTIPNLDEKYPQFHEISGPLFTYWENVEDFTEEFYASAPVTCDEDGMRADQAYLNDLTKFDAQFHYHIRDNNNVSTALVKLHAVLDQILAVNHSGTQ